jgi:FtsP/CotA-like multicopper oxidase with cupredoxin domain
MGITRRDALIASSVVLAGAATLPNVARAQTRATDIAHSQTIAPDAVVPPGEPGRDYTPVVTPGGESLPFRVIDGVKVFHLIAEDVKHEFAPGLTGELWGYNGRVHGPTIEAVEGDRVRIYVTNRLQASTTVHWHGVVLPSGMDGVGGLSQRAIHTGETFMYEWTFRQHGTFMYHSHHDEMTQMGMGMMGMIVVHPRRPKRPQPDRDFVIMLSEWAMRPGTFRPDTNENSDFNVLTMNARCYPGTPPLVVRQGQRVRIRFGNLSAMDHHPIHLHGYAFKVVETDGGAIAEAAQWPETSVLVPVGATRSIELVAHNPGDWAMHCHMTHHLMNQMGHGIPNMVGAEPAALNKRMATLLPAYMTMGETGMGEHGTHVEMGHMAVPENSIPMVGAQGPHDYITMGGMFTVLKVRKELASYDDPGWYQAPAGTQARLASAEELERDGVRA